ncbi:M23 family metallopeptidase [Chryseobacterium sp. FH1]|uniref:M23 family metallopeptidase n=1 Tax=Chryseobacterium sp. FH1 TaxID=1233951 RepID=UPI00068F9A7A|nr:M23 family metallopeptidase [Chryseobacterium sp. FH1]
MKFLQLFVFFFTFSLFHSQEDLNITIEKEKVDGDYILYISNNELAPVSIEFTYETKNMDVSIPNSTIKVIPANTKREIFAKFSPKEKFEPYSFKYKNYYVLGDINVSKADDTTYWLPYEKDKTESIYQGYNGNFSHQNAYSLDFSHKFNSKVTASRGGKVVFVKSDSDKFCSTKDCAQYNNKIIILHSDQTLGEYVHLKKNGSVVRKGDIVEQGQLIGYSGNTGWSKGPHLHFSVFTNKINGERTYYKTKFRVKESPNPIYLQEKEKYTRNY